jgi:predicted unusual protein kinase regulating ubiquinone biosynthesis (AarF/ABC1/UbiB family)
VAASARSDVPPALRALVEVAGGLVRSSSSGRLLLGRVAGLIPPEAVPEPLRELPDAARRAREELAVPLRAKVVEKTLKEAWGSPPGKVLDELDLDAPVAVTPLAQVHRAELDGEPVAVKVRRPGVEAPLRADLALLDVLRPPLAALLPRADTAAILAAVRERALDELDLLHEAEQERAAGRALRGTAGVEVPAVVLDLAAPAVKVTGWLDGPTLARHPAPDRPATARTLLVAHVHAARAGLLLPDARPNHVVLLRDGGLGLLGTGAAVAADRERVEQQLALATALRDRDDHAFAKTAAGLGLPEAADQAAARALAGAILGELLEGPARLDAAALAGVGERAVARLPELLALPALEPQDVWLARGAGQLVAVLARLGAREDWARLLDAPATASRGAGTAPAGRGGRRP